MIGFWLSGFIILFLLIADRTYISEIYKDEKDYPDIKEGVSPSPDKETPKN